MVTTRRQGLLQQGSTPPDSKEQLMPIGETSPATPLEAPPEGRVRLPLKSALKTQHWPGRYGAPHSGTPDGAGIKKKVRIHSSDNMVHEFQVSLTTDEQLDGSDGDGSHTPQSALRRRQGGGNGLARYNQFVSGIFRGSAPRVQAVNGSKPAGGWSAWLGPLFVLAWMLSSSALIFVNKTLMVDHGFRFPFALTSLGQISSMLLAWLASVLGVAPLRPAPSWDAALTKLLPISAGFAASLFLGNVAYLGLSVAFINIMKAATPLVTLTAGVLLHLEHPSTPTLIATTLIAVGTAISTASEAASGHFQWLSFLAFSASVGFEGIRVVLTEKLLGQAKYNVMEALVYLGPFTFALLAAGSYLFEWNQSLSTEGLLVMQQRPYEFLLAALTSFLVNLFCYLAIKYVSATSFKVAGCLKNVLVVWGGVLQGDVVTPQELQGYAISLLGFVLFSAAKMRGPGKQHGQQHAKLN